MLEMTQTRGSTHWWYVPAGTVWRKRRKTKKRKAVWWQSRS